MKNWSALFITLILLFSTFPYVNAEGNTTTTSIDNSTSKTIDSTSKTIDDDSSTGDIEGSGDVVIETESSEGAELPGENTTSTETITNETIGIHDEGIVDEGIGNLETYKSSLTLPDNYKNIVSNVINYVEDCESKAKENNQYDIQYSCMKDQYYIKEELGNLVGISLNDWKRVVDYLLLYTPGEPNYWIDDSGNIQLNFDKMIIRDKLGFNINPTDRAPTSKDEIWAGFWINWEQYGGMNEDQVRQADEDYRRWEDEQRQEKLLSEMSISVSSSQEELGDEIISIVKPIFELGENYDKSPSKSSAYALAYNSTISEATLRGFSDTKDSTDLKNACDYVKKNLNYDLDVWQNEFGETHLGRVYYKGDNVEINFDCNYDDVEGKTFAWLDVNWGSTAEAYKEEIKKARRDADIEARKAERAGAIKEFMDSFEIESDLLETAQTIVEEIDDFSEELKDFDPSRIENFYDAEYKSQLLRAKFEGIGDAFNCDDFTQIRDYVILYTKYGTPDIWKDDFGDTVLGNHKFLLENDYFKFEINSWGCQDFDLEEKGGMNVELRWKPIITDEQKNVIKEARKDSLFEAEKLRRHNLLLKARQLVNFTVEEETIGKQIITKLETIRNEALEFEKNSSKEKAYNLTYNVILIRSELEGLAMSYPDIAENIGKYVLLYGPGMPDVWINNMEEVEVGNHLQIFRSENVEINFNMWIDEYNDRTGFDLWAGGKYRKEFKDVVKNAEKEGWIQADKARRIWLAKKALESLEDKVNNTDVVINSLKEYVSAFEKYKAGSISAYDLEIKRLQTVDTLKDFVVDENTKDYLIVVDLGENIPPGDIWMNFEEDEINIGNWRALVEKSFTKQEVFTGLDAWCEENNFYYYEPFEEKRCGVNVHINWLNWTLVKKDIKRANEDFWKIKQEKKIQGKLNLIKNTETNYSLEDQKLIADLVVSINSLKKLASSFDGENITEFQYNILLEKDKLNDLLDKAENQKIVEVVIAKASGFHEYDEWSDKLRGVSIYSDDNIELFVRIQKQFSPFFVKEENPEFELQIDVIWKEWNPQLRPKLEEAFKKYESLQSAKRFENLIQKREKIIGGFDEIQNKVNDYENGKINLTELKNFINNLYFKLQSYDTEVAYLAAVSNNSFPDWSPVNIKIKTEHVNLEFYERDFTYRFGIGIGLMQKRVGESMQNVPLAERRGMMETGPREEIRNDWSQEKTPMVTGKVSLNLQGAEDYSNSESNDYSKETLNANDESLKEESLTEEDLKEIEKEKEQREQMLFETRQEMIKETQEIFSDTFRTDRSLFAGEERISIEGLKPRLRLRTTLTPAEMKNIANNFKQKFKEAKESGVLDDAIYNLNLELDNQPGIQQAIMEWGNVTTSLRLTYENESIFELSFRTEDGYIKWVDTNIAENAGESSDNMYIEVKFESLMELKNWWEGTLRDSTGPSAVIKAIPGFIGKVGRMIMVGEVKVKPFGSITKIPKFLQVLFNGMIHAIGVTI